MPRQSGHCGPGVKMGKAEKYQKTEFFVTVVVTIRGAALSESRACIGMSN